MGDWRRNLVCLHLHISRYLTSKIILETMLSLHLFLSNLLMENPNTLVVFHEYKMLFWQISYKYFFIQKLLILFYNINVLQGLFNLFLKMVSFINSKKHVIHM